MKNKMMRIASILMVAVLLTVCAVSGTFAKYVTTADLSDNARVAKWGIVITQEGDGLFAEKYATDDKTTYDGDYSVISSVLSVEATADNTEAKEGEKVVAPGTTNADAPIKFAISGTPEVAVKVTVELGEFTDIVLPKGTYRDYTVSDPDATFELKENYYPVKFTLKENGTAIDAVTGVSLSEIADFLDTYSETAVYAPGTVFATNFTLEWEWAFEQKLAEGTDAEKAEYTALYNKADTYLGNVAADIVAATSTTPSAGDGTQTGDGNGTTTETTALSTDIAFDLTITVTQID